MSDPTAINWEGIAGQLAASLRRDVRQPCTEEQRQALDRFLAAKDAARVKS